MTCDVVLIRQKWPDAAQLENTLASIHDGELVNRHQGFAELLVIETVRNLTSAAFAGVIGVDGLLAEQLLHLLERGLLLAAQKQQRIAVAGDGIGVVLVDGLELRLRLQNDTGRDLTAADSGDELFKIRNLSDVNSF